MRLEDSVLIDSPTNVQENPSLAARDHDAICEDYDQAFRNARLILSVFKELGTPVGKEHRILDFGTGAGTMVYALRKLGYNAFGTDIVPPSPNVWKRLSHGRLCDSCKVPLTVIDTTLYRLPYEDDFFDFVVSVEVMEHVQDHGTAFAEIRRVLKPGGKSFHSFPTRYRIIEPHVSVPLATIFQQAGYLYFWALIGFRHESDRGKSAAEVARKNYVYLRDSTKYLTKRDLVSLLKGLFGNISFVPHYVWKHSDGMGRTIYEGLSTVGMQKLVPLVARVLSPLRRWAIFFVKPEDRLDSQRFGDDSRNL
ncbi:MAG: class I SAM-dependent methyltransferase [Desulfomonile tiedjei]|uniref:Class I SAM-dependent methyltransferase n=1 Tax=Desulfomonile tiedjei TaxID=2358 RepID=A0A9D6V5C6_9BACT|nr:class I SAM-dependent methyltransferase [Desulfomonile tiedjei]